MELLRNKEIRRECLLTLAAALVFSAAGFFVHPLCGILLLCLGLLVAGAHLWFAARRYVRISALSRDIDRILHGEEELSIADSDEGELSILQHELYKMTSRLQEQSRQLAGEKVRLTNAIADIFHQVRTPLTSVNLGLSLLRDPDLPYKERLL